MKNLVLYLLCTFIWGSTWIVITFQLGATSPVASVFYRFLLSAVILLLACKAFRLPLIYKPKHHRWFLAQGICMFSVNYMLTYVAEGFVSSGMVAVTFTLLLYYNIFGTWFLFRNPIGKNVILGSLIGGLGIGLIFLQEILNFKTGSTSLWGLVIGAVATVFASAGNLISYIHRKENIPVMSSNAFGMFYGSLFTLLVGLILNQSFAAEWTLKYTLSLAYLAVFGSVIAFGAYLSLVGRIGAEKASYTSILSPVIALTLSSFFENFQWTLEIAIGIALCLVGNVITLQKAKKRTAG